MLRTRRLASVVAISLLIATEMAPAQQGDFGLYEQLQYVDSQIPEVVLVDYRKAINVLIQALMRYKQDAGDSVTLIASADAFIKAESSWEGMREIARQFDVDMEAIVAKEDQMLRGLNNQFSTGRISEYDYDRALNAELRTSRDAKRRLVDEARERFASKKYEVDCSWREARAFLQLHALSRMSFQQSELTQAR